MTTEIGSAVLRIDAGRASVTWALLAASLALVGCPAPTPPPAPPASPASPASRATRTPAATTAPDAARGAAFDPSQDQQILDIYRAERRGGVERARVYRELGLTDASGTPNRGRIAAYRASLSRFAKQNPRRWGDFVASLAEPPR